MQLHTNTHIHKHRHAHTHTHTHTNIHRDIYTHAHTHTNTQTQTHTETYTRTYAHKHTHTNTHTCTQTHTYIGEFGTSQYNGYSECNTCMFSLCDDLLVIYSNTLIEQSVQSRYCSLCPYGRFHPPSATHRPLPPSPLPGNMEATV